ncbi:MAG: NAD(P)H-quinone oxidoreductase [Candidatus Binatia bacterium]|nr:NAD(P)H-quinone oxidoreductase [Candidatus Binatia bacterium]MDG1959032.1 NAD(P)H-quinone oxidoreductase [Candidatus Binatia bacterium]MDG2008590.1 NAD(P)H-quinone oxidoreductase [Candidatus Binatia bacterium]
MKAIEVREGALFWSDHAVPQVGPSEVLIHVHATAVNRADLMQRMGFYPPPAGASPILGLECAGEVVSLGSGVSDFAVGDRVCALLSGGGYAEQVAVPAGQVLRIPPEMSFEMAAAIPEVFATAYLNLYREAALRPGERVLVHAGASGVGTASIQLCRALGNPCFVTVGSPEKVERCQALGAEGGWDRHEGSFLPAVSAWADPDGVDVILDPVGGAYLEDNLMCLSLEGRLVLIGLMGGGDAKLSLAQLMMKRLRVIGSTLRAQPVEAKTVLMQEMGQRLWPLFATNEIRPIVEAVLPITEASQAHALVEANQTFGKVVLRVN